MPKPEVSKATAAWRRAYKLVWMSCASAVLAVPAAMATSDELVSRSRFVDVATARLLVEDQAATVLDTRGIVAFTRGHIDGAVRFDWQETRQGNETGGRLPANLDALAHRFSEAGVDDQRPVLVCGDGGRGWGEEARVSWVLDALGKSNVHVLDGGCAVWRDAGKAWSFGPGFARRAGKFTARPRFSARASLSDVREALADPNIVLIDVRARDEFEGATPYGEARGGHVPRAVNLDWRALSDAEGRVLRGAALRSRLTAVGVSESRPAIVYCSGGVRSAFVTELLREQGIDARNYDGSMWEWAADATLPLE